MMQSIVLFRFHDHREICADRVRLLRESNPGIGIYGLYGGPARKQSARTPAGLEHVFATRQDRKWNWLHSDLAVRQWFIEVGHTLSFERVILAEWDLLYCAPLADLYAHVPAGSVGLSGLVPLASVAERWSWLQREPWRSQWATLHGWARKRGLSEPPYASLGPGPCFPRTFLERFARCEVPVLCHDELRLPLVAQLVGVPLADTGF